MIENFRVVKASEVEPLVVRPVKARKMLGNCGTTTLWKLIKSGKLKSYMEGNARMISVESIRAYITQQLEETPGARNKRPRPRSARA